MLSPVCQGSLVASMVSRAAFAAMFVAGCGETIHPDALGDPASDGGAPGASAAGGKNAGGGDSLALPGIPIPAETQRQGGDPAAGYDTLVNGQYLSIGIPWSGFSFAKSELLPEDALPGRTGKNAEIGYTFNASKNPDGLDIAVPNCLTCHASHFQGELVVGLGRPDHSIALPSGIAVDASLIPWGFTSLADQAEYAKYGQRLYAASEAGALNVFAAQAAHRDPTTLTWSASTSFDAHTGLVGWVDVPPWWHTKKKNALYYNGMGRGDHVRHMANFTIFSVHDTTEAERIDQAFSDIAAFLRSIESPKYPKPIDTDLAAQGQIVFNATCSKCHGTYGDEDTYPNLLIELADIGTDPSLAEQGWINAAAEAWFNESWYAPAARIERSVGYVAPPLDGIWATAPYFHNGSVPSLMDVLNSEQRPVSWSMSFGDDDYDFEKVGWKGTGDGPTYDTLTPGLTNTGHPFGDVLSDESRRAVVEYLKTL